MRLTFILILLPFILFSQEKNEKVFLYYSNNEFLPTNDHLKKIDSIKSIYKPENIDIILNGYANEIGNEETNLKLSKKRVEFVAALFEGYVISSTIAKGEIKGDLIFNRRVEIEFSIKKIIKPKEEKIDSIITEELESAKINDFEDLKIGDKIALKNIFFFPGNDLIKDSSTESLKELVAFLKQNEGIKIKILGHVCCTQYKNRSIDGVNMRTGKRNLSEARAKRVYDYLRTKGINRKRLDYVGLASLFPLEKGDDFDRRVEIEIIK